MRDRYRSHANWPDALHHDDVVQHYRHPFQAVQRSSKPASGADHRFAADRIGKPKDCGSGAQENTLRVATPQVRRLVGTVRDSVGATTHTPRGLTFEPAVVALAADDRT